MLSGLDLLVRHGPGCRCRGPCEWQPDGERRASFRSCVHVRRAAEATHQTGDEREADAGTNTSLAAVPVVERRSFERDRLIVGRQTRTTVAHFDARCCVTGIASYGDHKWRIFGGDA